MDRCAAVDELADGLKVGGVEDGRLVQVCDDEGVGCWSWWGVWWDSGEIERERSAGAGGVPRPRGLVIRHDVVFAWNCRVSGCDIAGQGMYCLRLKWMTAAGRDRGGEVVEG